MDARMLTWGAFLCLGKVHLKQFFNQQFGAPDVASVVYWGGLYKIHCHMVKVRP